MEGFLAREINKRIGKSGMLWQDEYGDRLIRNEQHFFKVVEYIRENQKGTGARVFQPVVERGKNGQECPFPCVGGSPFLWSVPYRASVFAEHFTTEFTEHTEFVFCSSYPHPLCVSLVRQAKLGRTCKLKGICLMN